MSKFKVGDKVAYVTKPDEEIGEVNCVVEDRYGCHVFVAFNEKKMYEMQLAGYNYDEDKLVKIDEYALSDDEIYTMLTEKYGFNLAANFFIFTTKNLNSSSPTCL